MSDGLADAALAWLSAYAVHSTLFLGGAWVFERFWRDPAPAAAVAFWRTAVVAAVLTASVQSSGLIQSVFSISPPNPPAPVAEPAGSMGLFTAPRPAEPVRPAAAGPTGVPWRALVLSIWLGGAGALAVRTLASGLALRQALSSRARPMHGALIERLDHLTRQAGLRQRPKLSICARIASPIVLPTGEICVPTGIEARLASPELDAMLRHELAHVLRRDAVWLLVAEAVRIALFFQPLNRLARARIVHLTEFAADDWAAVQGGGGRPLARCLAHFAQAARPAHGTAFVSPMLAGRSALVQRVERLLQRRPSSGLVSKPLAGALVAAMFGLAFVAPSLSAPVAEPDADGPQASAPSLGRATPLEPIRSRPAIHPSPARGPSGATPRRPSPYGDLILELREASAIASDSTARRALEAVDLARPLPHAVFAAYIDAAARIGSDSEMRRALAPLVSSPYTPDDQLARAMLVAGREIWSDSELSYLLTLAAARAASSHGLAAAYIDASRTIGSDGEQASALTALARTGRLRHADLDRLLAIADDIPSREHRVRLQAAASRPA